MDQNDGARAARLSVAQDYYKALLRPVYAGRKFIHAGGVAVALAARARALSALGAARPLLLAYARGTGEFPMTDEAAVHVLDVRGDDMVDQLRKGEATLRQLPLDVRTAIDRWDPRQSARVLGGFTTSDVVEVADRACFARRPAAWVALEDKIAIDEFWDAADVVRAPSRVVPLERHALSSAADALDRGMGTVWAADASDGIHGGAVGLRWVRPGDDGRQSLASLAGMAKRLRVMPFLEGIPASIHGIVVGEEVAVFRPVELVVLRREVGDRLFYAGCSNWFDPTVEDRESMRDTARRVGRALRDRVGYRGPFTIDGVLSHDGFLPTELNPRTGAGLGTLIRGIGDLPFHPLCWAATEGVRLDYRLSMLEQVVVEAADVHRAPGGWIVTPTKISEPAVLALVDDDDEYREARKGEAATATLSVGPGPMGGFVQFGLDTTQNMPGASVAPAMARALRFADRRLGTRFGQLTTPSDVRPARKVQGETPQL